MKNIFLLLAILLTVSTVSLKAQNTFPGTGAAGIGTISPDASSLLDVTSTAKGVLVPRMTKAQRDLIASPAVGLLIFQTNSTPGFYYYSGAVWTAVSGKGPNKQLSNLQAPTAVNVDLLPGVTGTTDLGSTSLKWRDVYTGSIKFADGTTLSTATGGGGGIGGSGTAGYLAKFTAAGTIGNSLLQENANSVWLGGYAFSPLAKFDVYNATGARTLYLQNIYSTTGIKEGIFNWVGSQGTGIKRGIYNIVEQTTGGLGDVLGINQEIYNYGTGNGYANFTSFDIIGSSTNYGNYTTMGGSASGIVYGDYKSVSGGTVYGGYKTLSGSGPVYGEYITIPSASGSNTKFGVFVNIPSTAGSNFGLFSQVSNSNTSAYSAWLDGKVYCTGNVGIGTLIPNTKLHVDGGTDAALASGGFIVSGSVTSVNVAIDNNEIMARNNGAASPLYLQNDGGDLILCYTSGNVRIGASAASAPGYLLAVDGNVICEELKVQLSQNWPDYVYEENYDLPSISELKTFVETNKHLPGIPTACELEENGISVGEMQTRMMQKIEEMSLYIIELQDQIDELKSQQ